MKVTFKRLPKATGLAGIAYPHQSVEIKLKRKQIGTIHAPNAFSGNQGWKIVFMVLCEPSKENPSGWKWITLKNQYDTEEEAREYVQKVIRLISKRHTFRSEE